MSFLFLSKPVMRTLREGGCLPLPFPLPAALSSPSSAGDKSPIPGAPWTTGSLVAPDEEEKPDGRTGPGRTGLVGDPKPEEVRGAEPHGEAPPAGPSGSAAEDEA